MPADSASTKVTVTADPVPLGADPEMQMNAYHMNEVLFLIQRAGVRRFHAELTDHGGELGVIIFFQKSL